MPEQSLPVSAASRRMARLRGVLSSTAQHGYLARPGEVCESIHLVIDGWAACYRLLTDGRRQITALYLPGDMCDTGWLGDPVARHHAIALMPLRTARIAVGQAREALKSDPDIAVMLWREQRQRNNMQSEWLVSLGRKSALERIASLFCELTERIGRINKGAPSSCEMPLTQIDIADITGLTPVHVNRVLQQMRASKLIHLHARRLKIFDFEALCRLAFHKLRPQEGERAIKLSPLVELVARDAAG